jgi:hypothetical protein
MKRDTWKRAGIGLLAVSSLGWSLYVLSVTTRNVLSGKVHLHGSEPIFLFSAGVTTFVVMCWMGLRGLRLALGVVSLDEPRVKLWRVCLGGLLLASLMRNVLYPASRHFQSRNLAEVIGMYVGWILIVCVIVWLIRSAFPRFQPVQTVI